jgi:predicted DNA-binding ArsR family transcriptional regulator
MFRSTKERELVPLFNLFQSINTMKLTELQKRIGAALVDGPKTAEELAEELNADLQDVLEALKDLILLKLVSKEGTPPKYSLAPHVKEALKIEDKGLLLHAIIEVEALEEDVLRKAMEDIKKKLEEEKGFVVRHVAISDIEKDEESGIYFGHIDTTVLFPGIEPLTYFLFYYGPTVVELLTTEKITIDPGDLQRAIIIAANMIHGYTTYISKLMTREELNEFNRRILKRLKK